MTRPVKPPEKAGGEALPAAMQQPFDHAPMLTFHWGRFLACFAIVTALAFSSTAFKPEAGGYFVALYFVAVGVLLLAAHKKLLD